MQLITPLRKLIVFFNKISFILIMLPMALHGLALGGNALAKEETAKLPAKEEDLFLYRAIGATYICVAREVDVEFSKAAAIAAITYVNLIEGRHGGKIETFTDKTFNREELIFGANNQLIPAAVEYCPDKIPKETKKKVKKYMKEINKIN